MFNLTIVILLLLATGNIALFVGDDCIILSANGGPGKCIKIYECDHAKKLLLSNQRPQQCGFYRHISLVCCPILSKLSSAPARSEEKCVEYHDVRNQITSIARGEKAKPREFPHMAAIGYGDKDNIQWLCGGSLISDQFILTAAHCVRSRNFGVPKWVRLGDLDLTNTTEEASPEDFDIAEMITHPNHTRSAHYNDIALIKLNKTARFNFYIKPACLQIKKDLPNIQLQAIGWGQTDYFGESSSHLLKADLNVIEGEKCAEIYNQSRKLQNGIVDNLQICAGDSTGKDACPGDSGGPLQYLVAGTEKVVRHFVVVGIISFGKGCGLENSAGVYTRVSSYKDWIENIVWPII